ncbi:MAG TPA: universal stress protein [Longimicrobium sp.]|nr:universal stress protein [Longimicrobium sp.]
MHPTQIRSVLAATDLTRASDDVLRAAAGLASAAGAKLHVVHAFDLDLTPYPELEGPPSFHGRFTQAEDALAAQLARTLPPGVEVASREVVIYLAHRAILDRAAEVAADVVVLGPHRGRPPIDRLLGATADRVIRSAACPCLVVRGPLSLPLRRVVAPLDLSDPARGALSTALGWIGALGASDPELALPDAELDVVHVVPRLFASEDLPVNRATIGPRLHEQVEEAVAEHGWGIAVREELVWGDTPAEEIVRYAREQGADLVVLATHGHGALKRALIGSVASAVARAAPCPVLLVPPSRWSESGEDAVVEAAASAG